MSAQSLSITDKDNRFLFGYLDHDPQLQKQANLRLLGLLALAPPGARGIGVVEKLRDGFSCTVSIRSPFRSFNAESVGLTPEIAIRRTLNRLEDEIYRWRYGGGSGSDKSDGDAPAQRVSIVRSPL